MSAEPRNFRSLYCQSNRCRPLRFSSRIFWACLHPHARPLALLIAPFVRVAFQLDFGAIEDAGLAESPDELAIVVNEFTDRCRLEGGFLRQRLYLRISGHRLLEIGSRYLQESGKPVSTDS